MFTHDIYPSKTGRSVLTLASELSELAAEMAKDKGITPKDARLALEDLRAVANAMIEEM